MITLDCLNFATPIEITSYEDGQPSSRHSKRQLHFMPFDENTQCHLGSNILKKKKIRSESDQASSPMFQFIANTVFRGMC